MKKTLTMRCSNIRDFEVGQILKKGTVISYAEGPAVHFYETEFESKVVDLSKKPGPKSFITIEEIN